MGSDKVIPIRFNTDDYNYLKKKAKKYKKLHHPDSSKLHFSTYCKKVLNGKIELDGRIKATVEELEELSFQLQKIGVNINQIARVANETGQVDPDELNAQKREIANLIKEIREVI